MEFTSTKTGGAPFIIDKNLGANLDVDTMDLTQTNADGKPVIELTQEQKYIFDTKGWLYQSAFHITILPSKF